MQIAGVNHENHRYPFGIVWTPIPVLSWIVPFIGHLGICSASDGRIFDFNGPFSVSEDAMAFGWPTKYVLMLNSGNSRDIWDEALLNVSASYRKKWYDFFCCNCHHFVKDVLNEAGADGRSDWGVVELVLLLFFKGRFVSKGKLVMTLAPFIFCCLLLLLLFMISSKFIQSIALKM